MNITKKFDRAFQWAGEKMGAEAKTTMSEEFKMLETEMAMRFDGMDRLHKSMNAYVKWLSKRGELFDDKEKGLPISYLGRTMISHGEDFESNSEFGNNLIVLGRAHERIAGLQEQYAAEATANWLESLERSLAMMKEYQAARKKLESRRLAYDASISKQQKAKRDDFRLEEELRTAKVKYEESSEDVLRRMQDIKDAEPDSVRDLTRFLDAELDFHERCVEELRRARRAWTASGDSAPASRSGSVAGLERRPTGRSRSNTGHSYTDHYGERSNGYIEEEDAPRYADNIRAPIRSSSRLSISSASGTQSPAGPDLPSRPALGSRSATFQGPTSLADRRSTMPAAPTPLSPLASVGALRGNLRPVNRIVTTRTSREDVFADRNDDDTASADSQGESPGWGGDRAPDGRSASPATSYGSALSRTNTNTSVAPTTTRKPPPPPPPSRATKPPPPPVPAKRNAVGY